jgi:hypothetical protein
MKDPALPAGVDPLALASISGAADASNGETDVARIALGGAPAWQRDVLSVSARVRAIVATLRPVIVRALSFWDHAVRSIRIGGRALEIDPSGSYRLR